MFLFATGSDYLVTIWDYETSKIEEAIFIPAVNRDKIPKAYFVKFLDPFPMIACSYSDGTVYINGVKRMRERNLLKARNYSWTGTKDEVVPVMCMLFLNLKMQEIKKINKPNNNEVKPKKSILNTSLPKLEDEDLTMKKNEKRGRRTRIEVEVQKESDIVEPEDEDDHTDNELDYNKLYANEDDEEKNLQYLILGDERGFVKIWDLRGLIKKNNIQEEVQATIKSDYNIKKKDDSNVEIILKGWIDKKRKFEKYTNIQKYVLVKEWQAHDDCINSISFINIPRSFITCSKDKKFKVWSFDKDCEQLAEVDISMPIGREVANKSNWKFTNDWENAKKEELTKIIDMYRDLGGQVSKLDDDLPDEAVLLQQAEEKKRLIQELKEKRRQEMINQKKRNKRYKPLLEKKEDLNNNGFKDDDDMNFDVIKQFKFYRIKISKK
jgi:WD40 repeat protein